MLSRTLSRIMSISCFALLLVFLPVTLYAEDGNILEKQQEFKSLVPSLVGLTLPDVQSLLPQYDLVLGSVLEERSEHKAGTVISQDQQADTNIARFSVINISIAISPERINTENTTQPEELETVTEIIVPEPEEVVVNTPAVEIIKRDEINTEEKIKEPSAGEENTEKTVVVMPQKVAEEVIETVEQTEIVEGNGRGSVGTADNSIENISAPASSEVTEEAESNQIESTKIKGKKQSLEPDPYNGRKLSFTLDPEGYVQVTRKITMTMKLSPPADNNNMQYQFNISGKPYNTSSPSFTHVFDEEGTVILTASARLPGQTWLHSESRRVNVGKYVPRKIKVPNIVGLSESKAAKLLKSEGLVVGNTRDKIVKGGSGIIEQMPKAGTIRTEDDNKIHYVKAVDEKFQVQLLAPSEGVETKSPISLVAKVSPKPRSSKTRYRFLINGKAYNSSSPSWEYTFEESGDVKLIAQAIINGEGTFESQPINVTVANAWKKPTAVISPYTVSVKAGETVSFDSASAYDANGTPTLLWDDGAGNTSTAPKFLVNTEEMSVGEHSVTLTIKDERGYEDSAKAQLLITEKDKELPQEVLAETGEPSDSTEEKVALESADDPVEAETETESQAENDTAIATQQNLENKTVQSDTSKVNRTDQATTEVEPVQKMTELTSNNDGINWGVWLWALMVMIVLVPILWIIKKLRGKAVPKESIAMPASPYAKVNSEKNSKAKVVSRRDNRFAKFDDNTKPSSSKPAPISSGKKKKSANPELVDFDLDVKPEDGKSKKDELTDFKLDD